MPTPTTPLVIAAERVPPMFRPNNQANLVPATPLNPAASMSFLPGLGAVRSGNVASSNGLDPIGDEELAQWDRQRAKGRIKSLEQAKAAIALLERQKVGLQVQIDGASARGIPLPRNQILRIRHRISQLNNRISRINRLLKKQQGGGNVAAPWQRRPIYQRKGRSLRPLIAVNAPVTPDPNRFAAPGINFETGQATIRAMQANIQPVTKMQSINGLGFLQAIPAPFILGGVAAGVIFLAARSGKRR